MSEGNRENRQDWEIAKERVLKVHPKAFAWYDEDGFAYVSLPHLGDAETQADAWLVAADNLAAVDVAKER
jgi:hypothetical protein